MRLRPQPRPSIDGRHFDVAIIGGGINGVAIARECARGGRRTLVVEQNDFASGTTSRSTRIIHGGLRYLEHGEIGLVRESLRERQRLLRERPHLVRPMQFVLAMPSNRHSSIEIRLGLWLYRKLAHARAVPTSASRVDHLLDGNRDKLRLFNYDDAQCEFPERLVAEWLADAIDAGAIVRNHTRALQVETNDGRVRGLRVRDLVRQAEYRVTAAHIVNATGPWADRTCADSGIHTAGPMIGGVRGSHLVLPRFSGAPDSAVYTEGTDGRPMFVIPWNGQVLVGTTEVRDDGDPSRTEPTASEIEYLRTSLQRLFPQAQLPPVSHVFAGIRPLPYAPDRNAGAITRRHFIRDHRDDGADGLLSIIGGKLTTAASLARECARRLGIAVPEPELVDVANADVVEGALDSVARNVALIAGCDMPCAQSLVSRHGHRAVALAHHIAADDRLRQPLADSSDYTVGEATFAITREEAVTLGDVLLRRVPIALAADWSDRTARECAHRIGNLLGWSDSTIETEVDRLQEERSAFLLKPAGRTLVA